MPFSLQEISMPGDETDPELLGGPPPLGPAVGRVVIGERDHVQPVLLRVRDQDVDRIGAVRAVRMGVQVDAHERLGILSLDNCQQ